MTKRIAHTVLLAVALTTLLFGSGGHTSAQSGVTCGTDMRVLVISATGGEVDLPAIQAALDFLGTPYDVYVATQHPGGMTAARLANGCHALYQGVILTTDNLVYAAPDGSYVSALTPAEFQALESYEAAFGIRQVTWYTYPTPALGFNYPTSASGATLTVQPTAAGAQVFSYLNTSASASPIPIQNSWTYLATPFDASTTPLLTDAQGHSLAAIHQFPDGRQNLAMTFDSNPYLIHAMVLSYGVVNWVTNGLFIGDRHTYVSPQIDDLFIDNTQWLAATPCGTNVDLSGGQFRITGADLTAVSNWQRQRWTQPLTAGVKITMAFNGFGTTSGYTLVVGQHDTIVGGGTGGTLPDTLTPAASQLHQDFYWTSHTFDHQNLDAITYANAVAEIVQNNATAATLGLSPYSLNFMVQPDVSGLGNGNFLKAAYDNGIRYLLSDTSKPGQDNPSPNVGFWNQIGQPGIFVIPRRANNLFFNVTAPADWTAEYNCHYNSYWGRDLTYSEILDQESDQLLAHLLRGELDPWMFHQPNLAAYDGTHTLLTDLLDRTLAKYGSYVTVPVVSPPIDLLGARMAARTTVRNYGISAMIQPGVGLVLLSPVDVTVPITGLYTLGAEWYAGQWITWVDLKANQTSIQPLPGPAPPAVTAAPDQTVASAAAVTLTGTASDQNSPALPLTYSWTQTAGPAVTLSNATTLTATFTAPTLSVGATPVTLGFTLTVSNGPRTATATTTVTVNPPIGPPTVNAGAAQTVASAAAVTLTGSATDPNVPARTLTYSWAQTAGPAVTLTNANAAIATFSAPVVPSGSAPASLTFTLTVSNGASTAAATTSVTVTPVPVVGAPVVWVGAPITVTAGSAVQVSGTATDPNVPARPLTYSWAQTGGPAVALTNATSTTMGFTAPPLALSDPAVTLSFTLTVSNGAASQTATTSVQVVPSAASVGTTVFSDGTGTRTVAISANAGDLVVALVSADVPTSGTQTATVSGGGLTWTLVRRVNTQGGTAEVWSAPARTAVSNAAITATLAFARPASLTVATFAGAGGVGASAGANAATGAATVALTTTKPGSLVWGVGNDRSLAVARTVGAGQTLVHQYLGPTDTHWVQATTTAVPAAGTTVTVSDPTPTTGRWNLVAVEILDAQAVRSSTGLVAAYAFSEASGPVADASGTGNTGTPVDTATTAGRFGSALAFNGTTSVVTVAAAPSLDLGLLTVEAWVKPTSLVGLQTLVYKERPDGIQTKPAWALYASESGTAPSVYAMMAGSTQEWNRALGATVLPLGTWSHVAATFTGTQLRVYVNGALVGTLNLTGTVILSPGPLKIGGHTMTPGFPEQNLEGAIDEVRVYNRALSAAEIQADMNAPVLAPPVLPGGTP